MKPPNDKDAQRLLDSREKSQVEPIPKNQEFFEWLERLFDGPSQFPEKIETRVVAGKEFERLGAMIKQIVFPPKAPKPTKEQLVALSNELIFRMQQDCDIQRKSVVYGIHVAHLSRDPDFYERWLHRCYPSPLRSHDGMPRPEEEPDARSMAEAQFPTQVLSHGERMFQLYGGGFEGLMDRFDRVLERQEISIEKKDARIEKLSEMLERALSLEDERREKREWNQLKMQSIQKAIDLGLGLAPPLLGQLMGGKGGGGNGVKDTAETVTLRNFFKKESEGGLLTEEQAVFAFGTDDGKPGVLSFDQAKLLWGVAHCQIPLDDLDKLLPGGPLEVTMDQIIALQSKFRQEQIAPLIVIFEARMRRKSVGN